MASEQTEQAGFGDLVTHYEKEQEVQREAITALAKGLSEVTQSIGKLTAHVETLIDNQKGMFDRINRPTQWGIFATFAGVIFLVVGLVITEIKDSIDQLQDQQVTDAARHMEYQMWFRESLEGNRVLSTQNETNIQWLMKLEDRLNARIHAGLVGERQ